MERLFPSNGHLRKEYWKDADALAGHLFAPLRQSRQLLLITGLASERGVAPYLHHLPYVQDHVRFMEGSLKWDLPIEITQIIVINQNQQVMGIELTIIIIAVLLFVYIGIGYWVKKEKKNRKEDKENSR